MYSNIQLSGDLCYGTLFGSASRGVTPSSQNYTEAEAFRKTPVTKGNLYLEFIGSSIFQYQNQQKILDKLLFFAQSLSKRNYTPPVKNIFEIFVKKA
jgi:hypothetical protein